VRERRGEKITKCTLSTAIQGTVGNGLPIQNRKRAGRRVVRYHQLSTSFIPEHSRLIHTEHSRLIHTEHSRLMPHGKIPLAHASYPFKILLCETWRLKPRPQKQYFIDPYAPGISFQLWVSSCFGSQMKKTILVGELWVRAPHSHHCSQHTQPTILLHGSTIIPSRKSS